MKNTIMIFFVGFFVAFGGGYFFYDNKAPAETTTEVPAVDNEAVEETVEEQAEDTASEAPVEIHAEARPLQTMGCLQCHRVNSLEIAGRTMTGPDLSNAYNIMEDKFGMSREQYFKTPNTAVMATVMGSMDLTDEQLNGIIEALKFASEN